MSLFQSGLQFDTWGVETTPTSCLLEIFVAGLPSEPWADQKIWHSRSRKRPKRLTQRTFRECWKHDGCCLQRNAFCKKPILKTAKFSRNLSIKCPTLICHDAECIDKIIENGFCECVDLLSCVQPESHSGHHCPTNEDNCQQGQPHLGLKHRERDSTTRSGFTQFVDAQRTYEFPAFSNLENVDVDCEVVFFRTFYCKRELCFVNGLQEVDSSESVGRDCELRSPNVHFLTTKQQKHRFHLVTRVCRERTGPENISRVGENSDRLPFRRSNKRPKSAKSLADFAPTNLNSRWRNVLKKWKLQTFLTSCPTIPDQVPFSCRTPHSWSFGSTTRYLCDFCLLVWVTAQMWAKKDKSTNLKLICSAKISRRSKDNPE